ncbi:MAG TPA: Flp family type IVb pilin [Allosphingosinicella sp.]
MRRLRELGRDRRGATAVEYALIMALVFLAMIAGVRAFAAETIEMWTNVADNVAN